MKPYFDDGQIAIYHGDCREVLPTLTWDSTVTDPPYGIGFAAQPTKWQRRAGQQAEHWDDQPIDDVVASLALAERPTIIWGGNYYALPPQRGWLLWTKPDAPPHRWGALRWRGRTSTSARA